MKSGWQLNKLMDAALSPSPLVQPDNCYPRAEGKWSLATPDRWTADRMDPPLGPRPCAAVLGLVYNRLSPPEEGKELCSQKEALSGREVGGID